MPNAFAYFVILAWPIAIIVMFRRLPIERAFIWSILGGYLLLPPRVGFDPPLIPLLDKASIPNITALVVCMHLLGRKTLSLPESRIGRLLIFFSIATPVATVFTNTEPIYFAKGGLPGLRIYDSFSAAAAQFIAILPFLLAYKLLATEKALREIAVALMVAGLGYSIPMLVEVRLSPQLNVWIYGFFQHGFDQMMRYGGYRPIVFLQHGLWVAFFALMTFACAVSLSRFEPREKRSRYTFVAIYLGLVLVLCKSASPLIYALAIVPLIMFARNPLQIRVAAILAIVVVSYPLLRSSGLIPVEGIVSFIESIDPERAASLQFRVNNEELLLTHASKKALFGWGAWERNFVYDYETGNKITTVDGEWIIIIGITGWFGYLGEFGLLALPLFSLARRVRRSQATAISPYTGPLCLIYVANLVDLLPNATLIPFTWLLGGALLGYSEALKSKERSKPVQQQAFGFKRPKTEQTAGLTPTRRVDQSDRAITQDLRQTTRPRAVERKW